MNRSVGHAVAGTQLDTVYGTIQRTTDGGATWDSTVGINDGGFQGVYFVTENEGWAVGGKRLLDNFDEDLVFHTTNGGIDWFEQPTPTFGPLYRVQFLNDKQGIAAGFSDNGTGILRTDNGGNTWNKVITPGEPQGVLDISFIDSSTIWVVRYESVHRTTDAGTTWQQMGPDTAQTIGVHFLDRTTGWLVGSKGSVWKYKSEPTSVLDPDVRFFDFTLSQNYPNPFNPSTTFTIEIHKATTGRFLIYDINGRTVAELFSGRFEPGIHHMSWDGKTRDGMSASSGVYFYRMDAGSFTEVKRMLLLK